MDAVLSQMDRRIVETGAEMSLLWQELSILEGRQGGLHFGAAPLQQNSLPTEVTAF